MSSAGLSYLKVISCDVVKVDAAAVVKLKSTIVLPPGTPNHTHAIRSIQAVSYTILDTQTTPSYCTVFVTGNHWSSLPLTLYYLPPQLYIPKSDVYVPVTEIAE